jgi:hypothetical protein
MNRMVDFHENWYGGNAIQGDLDAIISNYIASIILKLLRFKIVRLALFKQWVWILVPW